jgi:hypothetical protein
MTESAEVTHKGIRMSAYRWGLLAGLLIPPGVWGANHLMIRLLGPDARAPEFTVQVLTAGDDLSRHGAVKVVVSNERGAMTQTCSGPCDDLTFQAAHGGDNTYKVSVFDAAGRCIACDPQVYVTGGYGAWVTRWRVSGADALATQVSTLSRQADGTLVEKPFGPAAAPPANQPPKT